MVGRSLRTGHLLAVLIVALASCGDDDETLQPGEGGGGDNDFHNAPPIPGSGSLPGTTGSGSRNTETLPPQHWTPCW